MPKGSGRTQQLSQLLLQRLIQVLTTSEDSPQEEPSKHENGTQPNDCGVRTNKTTLHLAQEATRCANFSADTDNCTINDVSIKRSDGIKRFTTRATHECGNT
jgi:hypothetical protein